MMLPDEHTRGFRPISAVQAIIQSIQILTKVPTFSGNRFSNDLIERLKCHGFGSINDKPCLLIDAWFIHRSNPRFRR